jgi:glycine oxidase
MLCIFSSYNGRVEIAEVIVAGGGIIGLSSALELARRGIRLYPEYLSTVEAFSGRSVHVRTRAAISTDEEDGTSVTMSAHQAAELWPPIASAPVVESWTGLRPGTSDGLPVIGSAPVAG